MKYTIKDLFAFMDSGRDVRVICTDGEILTGRCWAYSNIENEEEFGVNEPSLEIGNISLYASEIEKIEYID